MNSKYSVYKMLVRTIQRYETNKGFKVCDITSVTYKTLQFIFLLVT